MAPLPQKKKSNTGVIIAIVAACILPVFLAIAVAVAVPIFSAVTKNSRVKTCMANQREIISTINNKAMIGDLHLDDGDVFTLTTNEDGTGTWSGDPDKVAEIEQIFAITPCCPEHGSQLTVTIDEDSSGYLDIDVTCDEDEHNY